MRKIFIVLFFVSFVNISFAKDSFYWVIFSNKTTCKYADNNTISDIYDLPIDTNYKTAVTNISGNIQGESRWLNAILVKISEKEYKNISQLPFVNEIVAASSGNTASIGNKSFRLSSLDGIFPFRKLDAKDLGRQQVARMGADYFKSANIDGTGIRIAVFDGGFPYVNAHPAFKHLRDNGKIVKTWDFTKNNEYVYHGNSHGTMVLSCIGGKIDTQNIGMATGAEYLLAITEINREPFIEELYWLMAMEWAYNNGANIISSSLGYHYKRYFPENMNGKKSLVARAATIAARKGMLVINAAGNDGTDSWRVICTPADADSIITVGGIDPTTNIHIDFSSFGPTADGRMKPNLCAYAHNAVATGYSEYSTMDGTSFATPLVAGFAACAWQMNKDKNNMQMLEELQRSGDLHPYFDYAHGYGVPQASYFFGKNRNSENTCYFSEDKNYIYIYLSENSGMNLSSYSDYKLFYNFELNSGMLKEYGVIKASQSQIATFSKQELFAKNVKKININFLNYTASYEIR